MKSDTIDLLDHAGWPVLMVEAGGTVRRANQAAISYFGPKLEGESTSLTALWPAGHESAEQFLNRWERSAAPMVPLRFCAKGGSSDLFNVHISTATKDGQKKFLFQLLPVVEASASAGPSTVAEANLVQKQRLECALQLTRTVALDFNNVLTSILGHTSLMLSQADPAHPFRTSLLEVEKAAGKAAEIAQHLTAFSRQEKEAPGLAGNLNSLLRRATSLFQHNPGSKISYALTLDNRAHAVRFDEAKMFQAFVKILENAREAVGDYGTIRVTSRYLEINSATQEQTPSLPPGFFLCVEIADDGPGMEAEVLARAFEPFFTTKKGHRGLGLAWVYGVITNHGGTVTITSAPKQGTTVRVFLPATRNAPREASGKGDAQGTGTRPTVLLVDDEDLMLTLGQAILSAAGYEVVTANNGQAALEVLGTRRSQIDVLVTDLVMPHMSGRELIEQMRTMAPGMPVVRMSGYVQPGGAPAEENYLQKPFTSQDLVRHVKQALDGSTAN